MQTRLLERTTFAFVALALAASSAVAAPRVGAEQARKELKQLCTAKGIKAHEKVMPNGQKRLLVNVSGNAQLDAISDHVGKGKNVLQILHHADRDSMHTLAIFDGELVHLQTPDNFQNWQLNTWGGRLRESGSKLYSAFIHLTPVESKNLRTRIALARKQQNASPDYVFRDAFGKGGMNCASGWCGVPIGQKGEPLHELIGLGYANGSPQGLQLELEQTANDRVFGLAIYGPKVAGFEKKATLFTFDE